MSLLLNFAFSECITRVQLYKYTHLASKRGKAEKLVLLIARNANCGRAFLYNFTLNFSNSKKIVRLFCINTPDKCVIRRVVCHFCNNYFYLFLVCFFYFLRHLIEFGVINFDRFIDRNNLNNTTFA